MYQMACSQLSSQNSQLKERIKQLEDPIVSDKTDLESRVHSMENNNVIFSLERSSPDGQEIESDDVCLSISDKENANENNFNLERIKTLESQNYSLTSERDGLLESNK